MQFRLDNISTRDESTNLPWSSNHLREAIEQGARKFGWARRDPRIGAMRVGDEIAGYGVAVCNWDAWRTPAEARVQLRSDGTAAVICSIQDIGTGTYIDCGADGERADRPAVREDRGEAGRFLVPGGTGLGRIVGHGQRPAGHRGGHAQRHRPVAHVCHAGGRAVRRGEARVASLREWPPDRWKAHRGLPRPC